VQLPCPLGYYCPDNTGIRNICAAGRFASAVGSRFPSVDAVIDLPTTNPLTVACGPCAPGSYCPAGSVSSTQAPCPGGRFGSGGSGDSNCSGACHAGHYCVEGSTNRTNAPCPEGSFCPVGAAAGTLCPAGRFGDVAALSDAACSGACWEGWWCGAGTGGPSCKVSPTPNFNGCKSPPVPCGLSSVVSSTTSLYCPLGAPVVLTIDLGFYSLTPGSAGFYPGVAGSADPSTLMSAQVSPVCGVW